jgi:bifunctional UDP-N-acetylglucosamine pyrophosphorylase/glucosamine-1-phosphate N-acetyltransferase
VKLTVGLWPGKSGFATRDLLGKPVWQRTLAATRGLGANRTLWLETSPSGLDVDLDVVDPRAIPSVPGTLLVVPAELGCVTKRTLAALLSNAGDRPRALSGLACAAATASDWRRALEGIARPRLTQVVRNLAPELVDPRDPEEEDALLVETPESWSRAARVLRKRKILGLLRRGVVVSDPDAVLVEPEVTVGAGTVLFPWVHLEGATVIGARAAIGSFTHVVDSVIGSETVVLDHCFIRSSRIGKKAQIGPFAHLRPDSDVGASAKVGNFVELKNTRLAAGAKAPHLTYLGDSSVGRGANIGAGTITCNYDGFQKHRTVVGDGAFIGSDVQLVAPVRVGKGAYVGAGSCIVRDVPAYALALARSRQVVKKGWARSRGKHASRTGQPGGLHPPRGSHEPERRASAASPGARAAGVGPRGTDRRSRGAREALQGKSRARTE